MRRDRLDLMRGSGNVFRDLGHDDADVKQYKAILAVEIIKAACLPAHEALLRAG